MWSPTVTADVNYLFGGGPAIFRGRLAREGGMRPVIVVVILEFTKLSL
jgi:hypothetical protein